MINFLFFAKLIPSVVAQEIGDNILVHVFSGLSTAVLLSAQLHSKTTRRLLSNVLRTYVIISSGSQLQDFVNSAKSFYATFKTKFIYAYCESLQVTLPSEDNPVLPGLIHLLRSRIHIQELAIVCYEPDFPQFIIGAKLFNLRKILIHYDPVSNLTLVPRSN